MGAGTESLPGLESGRARSLIALLVLGGGQPVARHRLAGMLWPDSTEAQARTNLRHLLHTLRRTHPQVVTRIEVTADSLRWRAEPPAVIDVADFEALLDDPDADGRSDRLRDAVAHYRGPLLDGTDDDWVVQERERLAARYAGALAELAELIAAAGDGARAVAYAERLLTFDPLRESTYRLLMRLHAANGDRAQALRTYHRCNTTLAAELGVPPSSATQAQYRALLPAAPTSRGGAAARPSGSAVVVGRDRERSALSAAWRDATAGHARLVVVSGDPGIGKTRLVQEFRGWCGRGGAVTAEAQCHAAEGPLPYGLITAWLRADTVRPRLRSLDRPRLIELARLLPELIAEQPGTASPEPVPEDEQRRRIFDAVVAAVTLLGGPPDRGRTVVFVADDLHHADRESCRLLHYLLRTVPGGRLLVVATVRAGEVDGTPVAELLAAAGQRDRLVSIDVGPLESAATAQLLAALTGKPVPWNDIRRLRAQTGGNPLFLVEAVRAGWRAGSTQVPMTARVQAVLASRLAQLTSGAREIAAAGAVIGRPFDTALLAAATWGADSDGPAVEDALVTALDELWRHGIVRERGGAAGAYDFAHEMLRNAAATELSPARRAVVHRRVAVALERAGPGAAGHAAEIAGHYAAAGDVESAVEWYLRASRGAQLLYAHAEALRLLESATRLLASLPPSARRDAAELDARTAMLAPLVSEHGYASEDLAAVQGRIQELTASRGVPPSAQLLRSVAMTALTRDDFSGARRVAGELRAGSASDPTGVNVVEAEVLLGFAAFWLAEFAAARGHLERAVSLFLPEHTGTHLAQFGQDPKAVALARLGNTYWFLGEPAAAVRARATALARAEDVGHPYSRAAVLLFAALLALDMNDEAAMRAHVTALLSCGVEARPLRLSATALQGLLAVQDGDTDDGLAMVHGAIGEAAQGAGAPGMQAILGRIRLAAASATGDAGLAIQAATELLATGPAAAVWAPLATQTLRSG